MPSDKPRINLVVGPKLRADLERVADARETTIGEIARSAIRKEIRKDAYQSRAMPTRREKEE
jgi:hypothetical protein